MRTQLVSSLLGLSLSLFASSAAAQELRFSTTALGGIASTGNTLGLSKAVDANGPGLSDAIGTFIALDPTSVDDDPLNASNPWPMGTTWDWTQNGSSAQLVLPDDVEILYAELVWAGSWNYGNEDVSAYLDDEVVLSFGNSTIDVSPDPDTSLTLDEVTTFSVRYYLRSAEVTSFVEANKGGTYTVSGVPATQDDLIDELNAAGWSLLVAYRGEAQPVLRNLSVFVGGSFVDENSVQDYTVEGFCAPQVGPVTGRLTVAALEGDADRTGDQLQIATGSNGPFATLSGPNNPEDNFFGSQINDLDGLLDTTGSFGMANHDALNGTHVPGGRQSWDHATVAVSAADGHLESGQTQAVIRTSTEDDSYMPVLVGLEIDVTSPDFSSSSTEADKSSVEAGDSFTLTATLSNSGEAPATNLTLIMPIDGGLELTSYSTDGGDGDANGDPVDASDVESGVDAGVLGTGETIEVVMEFDVVDEPDNTASFLLAPAWQHSVVVCDGDTPINESHSPPHAVVAFDAPVVGTGGGGGAGGDIGGPVGVGGGNDGGSGGSSGSVVPGNTVEEDGSCGCRLPGKPVQGGAGLAVLAALLLLRRRRDN